MQAAMSDHGRLSWCRIGDGGRIVEVLEWVNDGRLCVDSERYK